LEKKRWIYLKSERVERAWSESNLSVMRREEKRRWREEPTSERKLRTNATNCQQFVLREREQSVVAQQTEEQKLAASSRK
jgi:hypothetical protein